MQKLNEHILPGCVLGSASVGFEAKLWPRGTQPEAAVVIMDREAVLSDLCLSSFSMWLQMSLFHQQEHARCWPATGRGEQIETHSQTTNYTQAGPERFRMVYLVNSR